MGILVVVAAIFSLLFLYLVYLLFVAPRFNPLQRIAGPPIRGLFHNHLVPILE